MEKTFHPAPTDFAAHLWRLRGPNLKLSMDIFLLPMPDARRCAQT
jgi:hypothetical protein